MEDFPHGLHPIKITQCLAEVYSPGYSEGVIQIVDGLNYEFNIQGDPKSDQNIPEDEKIIEILVHNEIMTTSDKLIRFLIANGIKSILNNTRYYNMVYNIKGVVEYIKYHMGFINNKTFQSNARFFLTLYEEGQFEVIHKMAITNPMNYEYYYYTNLSGKERYKTAIVMYNKLLKDSSINMFYNTKYCNENMKTIYSNNIDRDVKEILESRKLTTPKISVQKFVRKYGIDINRVMLYINKNYPNVPVIDFKYNDSIGLAYYIVNKLGAELGNKVLYKAYRNVFDNTSFSYTNTSIRENYNNAIKLPDPDKDQKWYWGKIFPILTESPYNFSKFYWSNKLIYSYVTPDMIRKTLFNPNKYKCNFIKTGKVCLQYFLAMDSIGQGNNLNTYLPTVGFRNTGGEAFFVLGVSKTAKEYILNTTIKNLEVENLNNIDVFFQPVVSTIPDFITPSEFDEMLDDFDINDELPYHLPYEGFNEFYGVGNCVVNMLKSEFSESKNKNNYIAPYSIDEFFRSDIDKLKTVKVKTFKQFCQKYDIPYDIRNILGQQIAFRKKEKTNSKRRILKCIYYNKHFYLYTAKQKKIKFKRKPNLAMAKSGIVYTDIYNGEKKIDSFNGIFGPEYCRNFSYLEESNLFMQAIRFVNKRKVSTINHENFFGYDINSCYTNTIANDTFRYGTNNKIPLFTVTDVIEKYKGQKIHDECYIILKDSKDNINDNQTYENYDYSDTDFVKFIHYRLGYNKDCMHGFTYKELVRIYKEVFPDVGFDDFEIIKEIKTPSNYIDPNKIKQDMFKELGIESYSEMTKAQKNEFNICNGKMGICSSKNKSRIIANPDKDPKSLKLMQLTAKDDIEYIETMITRSWFCIEGTTSLSMEKFYKLAVYYQQKDVVVEYENFNDVFIQFTFKTEKQSLYMQMYDNFQLHDKFVIKSKPQKLQTTESENPEMPTTYPQINLDTVIEDIPMLCIKEISKFYYLNSRNVYNYVVDISNRYLLTQINKNNINDIIKIQTDAIYSSIDLKLSFYSNIWKDEIAIGMEKTGLSKKEWTDIFTERNMGYQINKYNYSNIGLEFDGIGETVKYNLKHSHHNKTNIHVIEGAPGTGKTYYMKNSDIKIDKSISITRMAAQQMENSETDIKADTFYQSFGLRDDNIMKTLAKFKNKTIWIDEFSMLDGDHYKYIYILANVYGCKFYLTGDRNQCQPITIKNDYDGTFLKNFLFNSNYKIFTKNYRCSKSLQEMSKMMLYSKIHKKYNSPYNELMLKSVIKKINVEPNFENKNINMFFVGTHIERNFVNTAVMRSRKLCYIPINKKFFIKKKVYVDWDNIKDHNNEKEIKKNTRIKQTYHWNHTNKTILGNTIISKGVRLSVEDVFMGFPRNKIFEVVEGVTLDNKKHVYDNDINFKVVKLEDCVKYKNGEECEIIEIPIIHLSKLKLAFAVTIHNIQGSTIEEPVCIVNPEKLLKWDKRILYTAITRLRFEKHLKFLILAIDDVKKVYKDGEEKMNKYDGKIYSGQWPKSWGNKDFFKGSSETIYFDEGGSTKRYIPNPFKHPDPNILDDILSITNVTKKEPDRKNTFVIYTTLTDIKKANKLREEGLSEKDVIEKSSFFAEKKFTLIYTELRHFNHYEIFTNRKEGAKPTSMKKHFKNIVEVKKRLPELIHIAEKKYSSQNYNKL